MDIDERIQALAMNLELSIRDHEDSKQRIDALIKAVEIDAENIRSLARIAEAHEHRLTDLEGDAP